MLCIERSQDIARWKGTVVGVLKDQRPMLASYEISTPGTPHQCRMCDRSILLCHPSVDFNPMSVVRPLVAAFGVVRQVKNSNSPGWILQRADPFPTTAVGSH